MKFFDSTIRLSNNVKQTQWMGEFAKVFAFVKKDMRIAVSYKLQFIFQFLQIFFSVAVIYFIGRMLGSTGGSSLLQKYGNNYFSFALVGLAVNSYLRAGLVTLTNDIRQIMNQGTLEAMCATPTNYTWLLLCMSLWQFIFETIRVVCYFFVAIMIFGMQLDQANWCGGVMCMLLTLPIFLMLGVISSSILIVVKRGDPINWIFSSLSALLAGTMFPVSVMPDWLRVISWSLPLTHSLEATRLCLLSGASMQQVSNNMLSLLGFNVILIPLTIFINKSCMKAAKKQGAFLTH